MREIGGSDNEIGIGIYWFATNTYNLDHSQLLGSNLRPPTAHRNFLVGTVSYAALPGVPTPDYVLPDGFLDPSGDTVVWWFHQTIEIPPDVMPSDGVHSITVVDPVLPTYSVGVNSPTNLAGDTGTITSSYASENRPCTEGWVIPDLLIINFNREVNRALRELFETDLDWIAQDQPIHELFVSRWFRRFKLAFVQLGPEARRFQPIPPKAAEQKLGKLKAALENLPYVDRANFNRALCFRP
jgi:hypothetical protein